MASYCIAIGNILFIFTKFFEKLKKLTYNELKFPNTFLESTNLACFMDYYILYSFNK